MPSRPPFFVLGSNFFPLSFTGLFRYTVPSLLSPVFPLRLGGFPGLGKGGGWYYPLVSLLLLSRCLFVLFPFFPPVKRLVCSMVGTERIGERHRIVSSTHPSFSSSSATITTYYYIYCRCAHTLHRIFFVLYFLSFVERFTLVVIRLPLWMYRLDFGFLAFYSVLPWPFVLI